MMSEEEEESEEAEEEAEERVLWRELSPVLIYRLYHNTYALLVRISPFFQYPLTICIYLSTI